MEIRKLHILYLLVYLLLELGNYNNWRNFVNYKYYQELNTKLYARGLYLPKKNMREDCFSKKRYIFILFLILIRVTG